MAIILINIKVSSKTILVGFLISLLIQTNIIEAQEKNDNYIYSLVIENFFNQRNIKQSERNEIVIIKKFKPNENYASEILYIFDNDTTPRRNKIETNGSFANQHFVIVDTVGNKKTYWDCNFDFEGKLINDNRDIRKAIENLKANFYNTPNIKNVNIKIENKYYLISSLRRRLFFISIFGDRITKGWKKFYKKFPKSIGYIQYSTIQYNKNYACLYLGHSAHGLAGSGNIIILKNISNNWKIIAKVNVWMS